jgi:hypothetical protein
MLGNHAGGAMNGPTVVDLVFKVIGSTIPQDHGYALYAAMARVVTPITAPLTCSHRW